MIRVWVVLICFPFSTAATTVTLDGALEGNIWDWRGQFINLKLWQVLAHESNKAGYDGGGRKGIG